MSGPDPDTRLKTAGWLTTPEIQAVFEAVEQDGDTARAVGGAVRNTLLGQAVKDVDIATTARPETVVARAKAAGLKPIPTGIEHGTVTVISGGIPYEVTTLREDVETFGRKARVAFGTSWHRDASRRDFTMNALYADRQGILHDPLGGAADCLAGRVRFIGDPESRICEDYLRILRFFRFNASYGTGDPDRQGLAACERQQDGLAGLSAERIGHEVRRLLTAPRAAPVVLAMQDAGIWTTATGCPAAARDFAALRKFAAFAPEVLDPIPAIAVLLVRQAADIALLTGKLRLSNAEAKRLSAAVAARAYLQEAGPDAPAELLLYRFGRQGAIDGVLAVHALKASGGDGSVATDSGLPDSLQSLRTAPIPEFPVKGSDLIALGYTPGREIGEILSTLENNWRRGLFKLTREKLLRQVESRI